VEEFGSDTEGDLARDGFRLFGSRLTPGSNNKHQQIRTIRFMTHFQTEIAGVELR
jgi:hypothetical protein